MPKISNKTLLPILSVGLAVMIPINVLLLVLFFTNPAGGTDMEAISKAPEFDTAIDAGIARYVARQQEDSQKTQEEAQRLAAEKAKNVPALSSDDHVLGDRNAEILLIEYSDFECPWCQKFHPTAQQIPEKYSGEVAWVLRQFPLDGHAGAFKKAEASECVAKLGGAEAFWEFGNSLFEDLSYPVENLATLAAATGVSETEFKTCLDSGEMSSKVRTSLSGATNAGISGTPGNILLNTKTGEVRLLPGAVDISVVDVAIKELQS